MAVTNGMFMFEILVENVKMLIKRRNLTIKSDFADVFSLELRHLDKISNTFSLKSEQTDKKKHLEMPKSEADEERSAMVLPLLGQGIQLGQLFTFSSSTDVLIQNMNNYPLALSLWDEKDKIIYMGSAIIPWNSIYRDFLRKVYYGQEPLPVILKRSSNIFQDGTGKITATIELQLKLPHLTDSILARYYLILDDLDQEVFITQSQTTKSASTLKSCSKTMQIDKTKKNYCTSIYTMGSDETVTDAKPCRTQARSYDNPMERVYIVYYFTVEYNFQTSPKSKGSSTNDPTSKESSAKEPSSRAASSKAPSSKGSPSSKNSSESLESEPRKFPYCPPTCPIMKYAENALCSKEICSIHKKGNEDSSESKCTSPVCTNRLAFPPSPADSNIVIKFKEIYNPCCVKSCDMSERVKEFIATNAIRDESRRKSKEMEDAQDPCYCDCVCDFKFTNKTTYCGICGGYECLGDDTRDLPDYAKPHPCPVYHKLYNKKYIKVKSPWPEEEVEQKKDPSTFKLAKAASSKDSKGTEKAVTAVKVAKTSPPEKEAKVKEAGQETKTKKKEEKKKVGKFTSNTAVEPTRAPLDKKKVEVNKYAYPAVPKHMGWNWLAKDIPGMEPRAKWKPGAANKVLVRRYRSLMEGSDTIAKKKRALMQRKKKIEMKPTLIVTKQEGEFTVQMEVFKKYSKERLLYQYPYDEKPPLIYTIGKTEAEKNKLQRQRERRARRETRRKSRLLQSTFRDKCQEICLKAYNQAIGLQPMPNPNYPDCPCDTKAEPSASPAIDSCSCSDEVTISSSDTDHDDWVIEFTPPMANWDAKAKHPPVTQDGETQYTYLDYKVKLLDRSGNPVPRFFISHEGKEECSDLGGFWGPGHVWLEINKDGYIGPDERWIPMNFFGPDGMSYSAEEGFFTDNTGQVLHLGVDGYIDKDLKWVWYIKKKQNKMSTASNDKVPKDNAKTNAKANVTSKPKATANAPSGKAAPGRRASDDKGTGDKARSGKGASEKGTKKTVMVLAPTKHAASTKKGSEKTHNPIVMNVSITRDRNLVPRVKSSRRPFVDLNRISKYKEIMSGFQTYNDYYAVKSPKTTDRASNTLTKKPGLLATQERNKSVDSVTNVTKSCGRTINNTTGSSSGSAWCKYQY